MTTKERWVGIEDIAIHLGVTKVLVCRWIESGSLPAHQEEGLFCFKLSEIDEWVRRNNKQDDTPGHIQDRLPSRLTIEQRVCQALRAIADWLPNDQEVRQSDSLKNDLGFDSLAIVHLQVAIENEFEFRFDPVQTDFIAVFDTAGSLMAFLINAGVAGEEQS